MSTISSSSSPSPTKHVAGLVPGALTPGVRWRPVSPGRGLRAIHPPARYLRPLGTTVGALALLGALWLPFGHIVPTTATLTQAAPRVAGRLVAGVRERFPASVSAGAPESAVTAPVAVTPAPAEVTGRPTAEGPAELTEPAGNGSRRGVGDGGTPTPDG